MTTAHPAHRSGLSEDDCAYVWHIDSPDRCEWVTDCDDCWTDSPLQYIPGLFCTFPTENIPLFVFGLILYVFWLMYLFLILGITADNFFCPALSIIAEILHLSDNIAGVTILAFGNGAPDIFTALVAPVDETVVMFNELIGAGVFVTSVIAGSVAVTRPFQVKFRPYLRDTVFYLVAVCWIGWVIRDETVHLWEAINIALDVERKNAMTRDEAIEKDEDAYAAAGRPEGLFREFFFDVSPMNMEDWNEARGLMRVFLVIRAVPMFFLQLLIPVVNQTAVKRGWSKLLNCLQFCVTPVVAAYILDVGEYTVGPIPVYALIAVIGVSGALTIFLITDARKVPKFHNGFAFMGFLSAMAIVYLIAQQVYAVLATLGTALTISDGTLGMLFLAWGNSIGDLISNVAIARRGYPRMGYAACFGGPLFNTLLGMGLTYSLAAAQEDNLRAHVRASAMGPGCIAFLLTSLTASACYLLTTGCVARRSYGFMLYTIYFMFVVMCILAEINVIHPMGSDHRDE
ncbi:mitochondrial sodium/calcium exchanger protein-like [Athalia rosae]|uniref:mitochondrial sodium/calcium exchanger protein-like n=1 Tax=Athalia rosae TaxID=37344 RepID=UPI002033EF4F|nr:mitochondrial sodium/calcium exchanger protein-like [Athalia rosae]